MLAVDVAGTLNPALTNQAFTRPSIEPSAKAEKPEPVSNTTKSEAVATGVAGSFGSNAGDFKPVVGPSQPTESHLLNTYKSNTGAALDVFL